MHKLFLAFERLQNFFSFSWSFASSPERLVYARCQFTPSFTGITLQAKFYLGQEENEREREGERVGEPRLPSGKDAQRR